MERAKLVLEDGRVFQGSSFGAKGTRFAEVVFNTAMSGYQEILTDPSYYGQIVAMTYPLIGNYGINSQDVESRKIFLTGFAVREASRMTSNWRCEKSLSDYLKDNSILGIAGIDTRALTRHIRLSGAMKAAITTEDLDEHELVKKVKASSGLVGLDLVKEVICERPWEWNKKGKYKVVVVDCGVKFNILRELEKRDCRVVVVPAKFSVEDILNLSPDGVLFSNGPGDPAAVNYVVCNLRKLLGKVPVFGICLGHQMLGLALGGKTYKLKFGHHGANQPVKDLRTGKVYITSQNHGFCVDVNSLDKDEVELTHLNLNDCTCEGMRHKEFAAFSVQFHPENSPGPHEADYLFGEFIEMMHKL